MKEGRNVFGSIEVIMTEWVNKMKKNKEKEEEGNGKYTHYIENHDNK